MTSKMTSIYEAMKNVAITKGKKLCTRTETINVDDEGNEWQEWLACNPVYKITRWFFQFPGVKSKSYDGVIHVTVFRKSVNGYASIEMVDLEPQLNSEYMYDRIIVAFIRLFTEKMIVIEGCDMLQAYDSSEGDDSDSVEIVRETQGDAGRIRVDENGVICIDC